jgi:hypothetical protein
MNLLTWKKPDSNEVRVYFNDVYDASEYHVQVFAVESDTLFQFRFSENSYNLTMLARPLRSRSTMLISGFQRHAYRRVKDSILDYIDRELEEMNSGEPVLLWSDLLALAKATGWPTSVESE